MTISCQTLKVSKWHTGIVFILTGAPVKDWHDRGTEWVQRSFWGLKFWFELIFLSGLGITPGLFFGGGGGLPI